MISMYAIILRHFFADGNGRRHYPNYKRQIEWWYTFMDFHNNAFMLISGIVGYKTNKYANLLYLWLTAFFYSVGIHKYIIHFQKRFYINQPMYKEYFPMIFQRYWYFTAYFGMYIFLPVINKGISYLSKGELKFVVITTLGIINIWRYYKNPKVDVFNLNGGSSVIWLLTFYLTGAYIGKYHVDYSGVKKYIYCILLACIYFFFSYLFFKVSHDELYLGKGYYQIEIVNILKRMLLEKLDSLTRIIQAITICLFFMQIRFNKYLAKFISFFGPLIFGIYLTHNHKVIKENISRRTFIGLSKKLSVNDLFSYVLLRALKMFIICTFVDYLRHLLFTILRIRKILIVLEEKIKEII